MWRSTTCQVCVRMPRRRNDTLIRSPRSVSARRTVGAGEAGWHPPRLTTSGAAEAGTALSTRSPNTKTTISLVADPPKYLRTSVLLADPPSHSFSPVGRRPPRQRSIKRKSPAIDADHGSDAGPVFEFRLDFVGKRGDGVPEDVRSNVLGPVRPRHS